MASLLASSEWLARWRADESFTCQGALSGIAYLFVERQTLLGQGASAAVLGVGLKYELVP